MIYTKIPKPTSTPYSNVNALGKEQYDDLILYDSPTNFYDGVNQSLYSKVSKPSSTIYTKITKPV